jgi:thiol-disulfide isomerase/thioredoxin
MMKKIVVIIICVLVLLTSVSCYFIFFKEKSDAVKFKEEYESLNGVKKDNGKTNMSIEISKDNPVKYSTFDDIMDVLDNGTGIIYFGFPECPWCRNAVPVLLEAAKEMEVENIYYFNALDIRDEKELKDGKVVTTKKGTKEYYKLVDKLSSVLTPYEGLEDDSIKRLYFPTAVFVMGGKIVGSHIGTVDSQEDPYKALTKKQKKELLNIYKENIEKIYGVCDKNC